MISDLLWKWFGVSIWVRWLDSEGLDTFTNCATWRQFWRYRNDRISISISSRPPRSWIDYRPEHHHTVI